MLESFTFSTFQTRLNDEFRLTLDGGASQGLELVEARESPAPASGGRRVPFSVVFRATGTAVLPQGTYRMEHPALGAFDLFIVPIARDGDGVQYEAVFG